MTEFNNIENEMIAAVVDIDLDPDRINVEKSDEFVINSRGEKLHVRSYVPAADTKAAVVVLHGYNAHVNRPVFPILGKHFVNENIALITFDFHGHGYSDGKRCLIRSEDDLLDDVWVVLKALYCPSSLSDGSYYLKRSRFDCPFFLLGQSLGGAVTIEISQQLTDMKSSIHETSPEKYQIASYYNSSILNCPAIGVNLPHYLILQTVRILARLFPENSLPSIVDTSGVLSTLWKNPNVSDLLSLDKNPPNPRGLTFGYPIRFITSVSVVLFIEKIQKKLSDVSFSFVVIHDPNDKIVSFDGSSRLLESSKTDPKDKKLVSVDDGRHELFSNVPDVVFNTTVDWIHQRLELSTK